MRSGMACSAQRSPEVGRGQAAAADPSAAGGLKEGSYLLITVILVMVVPMTLREMTVPAAASESAERTIAL
jgi:hypothetical protein